MTATYIEALATALSRRGEVYRRAFDRLRELATDETENEVYRHTFALQEAIVLVGCLRRLLQGRTARELHDAFGAPGDFGYETPIGAALDLIYRGTTPARGDAAVIERRDGMLRDALLVQARACSYSEPETVVAQYMGGEPVTDRIGTHGKRHFDLMRQLVVGHFADQLSRRS